MEQQEAAGDASFTPPKTAAAITYNTPDIQLDVLFDGASVTSFSVLRKAPPGKEWGGYDGVVHCPELASALGRALALADNPEEACRYLALICCKHKPSDSSYALTVKPEAATERVVRESAGVEISISVRPTPASLEELLTGGNPYWIHLMRTAPELEEFYIAVSALNSASPKAVLTIFGDEELNRHELSVPSNYKNISSYINFLIEYFEDSGREGVRRLLIGEEQSTYKETDEFQESDAGFNDHLSPSINAEVQSLLQGTVQSKVLESGACIKLVEQGERVSLLFSANEEFDGEVLVVTTANKNVYFGSSKARQMYDCFKKLKSPESPRSVDVATYFFERFQNDFRLLSGLRYNDFMDQIADHVRYQQQGPAQWFRLGGKPSFEEFHQILSGKEFAEVRVDGRSSHEIYKIRISTDEAGRGEIVANNLLGIEVEIDLPDYDTRNADKRFERKLAVKEFFDAFAFNPENFLQAAKDVGVLKTSDLPAADLQESYATLGKAYDIIFSRVPADRRISVDLPRLESDSEGNLIARVRYRWAPELVIKFKDGEITGVELKQKSRPFRMERDVVAEKCEKLECATILELYLFQNSDWSGEFTAYELASYLQRNADARVESRARWFKESYENFKSIAGSMVEGFKSIFRRKKDN